MTKQDKPTMSIITALLHKIKQPFTVMPAVTAQTAPSFDFDAFAADVDKAGHFAYLNYFAKTCGLSIDAWRAIAYAHPLPVWVDWYEANTAPVGGKSLETVNAVMTAIICVAMYEGV